MGWHPEPDPGTLAFGLALSSHHKLHSLNPMSILSNSIKAIGNLAVDLSELEVITLTGTLSQQFASTTPAADGNNNDNTTPKPVTQLKWSQLVTDSITNPNGTVKLAASTVIKFDGDSYKFVGEGVDQTVLDAHDAAVAAAQETRSGLLTFFRDTLQSVVK